MAWFLPVSLLLFGLLFGSFANVIIWRFPRGESLAFPGSHCPTCDHDIRWYDNIPVVSWVLLRGRCRDCGSPISWRYPAVEALSGALWAAAGLEWGMSAATVVGVVFFYTLLVLSYIDLDTMRLPNRIVGFLAIFGVLAAVAGSLTGLDVAPLIGTATGGPFSQPLVAAGAGAVLGAGLSLAVATAYGAARGRAGFGMGDVKLLGAMGLFLGAYVLLALLVGSFVGAAASIVTARRHPGVPLSRLKIPFGPYLALGGIVAALAGPAILSWYLGIIGL